MLSILLIGVWGVPNGGEKLNAGKTTNGNLDRGDGETSISYLRRLSEFISKLEWQSEGHRMWYTHKNPYGCWICELLQVCGRLRDLNLELEGEDITGDTIETDDLDEEI